MSKVTQKTKRQILLLGVPLIMKIKSEERVNLNELKERISYLKSKNIVPENYTLANLVNDTCICASLTDIPVSKSKLTKKRKSRSRSRSRSKRK